MRPGQRTDPNATEAETRLKTKMQVYENIDTDEFCRMNSAQTLKDVGADNECGHRTGDTSTPETPTETGIFRMFRLKEGFCSSCVWSKNKE